MRIFVTSLLFAAVAACTESPSDPRTGSETSEIGELPTSCGCEQGVITDWTPGTVGNYWFGNAPGMSFVTTGNSADTNNPNTFLVFGFGGPGYNSAWIYRVPLNQYGLFMGEMWASFAPHRGQPDVWIGGGGGLDGVGPGPGLPHGVPPFYVMRMQREAMTMVDAMRLANAANQNGGINFASNSK